MLYPSYVFIAAERRWVQLPLHHAQVYNIQHTSRVFVDDNPRESHVYERDLKLAYIRVAYSLTRTRVRPKRFGDTIAIKRDRNSQISKKVIA